MLKIIVVLLYLDQQKYTCSQFSLKLFKLSQLLLYKHERIPYIGFTHVRKVAT